MPPVVCAEHLDQVVRPGRACPRCTAEREQRQPRPDRDQDWRPLHRR